jgi:hypothetical protein
MTRHRLLLCLAAYTERAVLACIIIPRRTGEGPEQLPRRMLEDPCRLVDPNQTISAGLMIPTTHHTARSFASGFVHWLWWLVIYIDCYLGRPADEKPRLRSRKARHSVRNMRVLTIVTAVIAGHRPKPDCLVEILGSGPAPGSGRSHWQQVTDYGALSRQRRRSVGVNEIARLSCCGLMGRRVGSDNPGMQ